MDDKLSKLDQIVSILDKDTVTQEEFVDYFSQLIDFVKQLKDSNEEHIDEIEDHAEEYMNKCMATMEQKYASEWAKIRDKVASLRNGKDGRDGVDGRDGRDGKDGKDGRDGEKGEDGLDLFPDTPEQLVEKVNTSKVKINREQIDGLKDIENMAKANAMPVTTTHFYRDGISYGRAKNINMVGSKVEVIGDQGYITPITVSDTAPSNPFINMLWLDIS